jgi:hypothetical protein
LWTVLELVNGKVWHSLITKVVDCSALMFLEFFFAIIAIVELNLKNEKQQPCCCFGCLVTYFA